MGENKNEGTCGGTKIGSVQKNALGMTGARTGKKQGKIVR